MGTRIKITVVVVAVILVLAFIGIMTYANRADQSERVLVREVTSAQHPVQTVVVSPKNLVETLSSTGVLQAEQDVVVTSEVGGKVQKVMRKLGDRCRKGDLLVRLDAEGYRIAMAQAEAAVKQSEVALDHAERDWKRMKALQASAVATAQQLDAAEGAKSSQAAAVEQATAARRLAARNLREASVRCPFTGFVAELHIDTGSAVMPQTPLARLVDTSRLKLVLSVTGAEIGRIQVGKQVIIRDTALANRVYHGTVTRLGVAADSVTRTFPVEVSVKPANSDLRTGQVVHVSLELQTFENVIAVPSQAILTDPVNGTKQVLVAIQGVAQSQAVEIGPQIDGFVIVTKGLASGSEIITVGGDELENGMSVEVRKREKQTATDGGLEPLISFDNEKKSSR